MSSKYNERVRNGTVPYRLGRMNRVPDSSVTVDWTDQDRKDYKRGQKDRKRLVGRRRRRNLLEGILVAVGTLLGTLAVILMWALVCALPFVVGGLLLHWLGVI